MFLIQNLEGKYWDGLTWNSRGKEFISFAAATRSLHEEGEDLQHATIIEINDSTEEFP